MADDKTIKSALVSDNRIRQSAAKALQEILHEGGYAAIVIDRNLKALDEVKMVPERDRRFFSSLIYETIRHQKAIDEALASVSKTPLKKVRPYVLACLRLGCTQLFFMEGVKPYAAISETVELVKKAGFKGLAPYVNGVLRSLQRQGKLKEGTEESIPGWILEQLEKDYGTMWAKRYTDVIHTIRPVCFRMNLHKSERNEILGKLRERFDTGEGSFREGHLSEAAVYVKHSGNIGEMDLYKEGMISVQDESSMVAVLALGAKQGDKVLDLCAAPGGKSAYAAERMKDLGSISARDIHPHRVHLIEDTAERLGLQCIHAEVSDAMTSREEDKECFDRVLLDAPCSGLGIVRSKRDIAYNREERDIYALAEMQKKMLETAAAAVKKGGRLVYSTCTLTKEENDNRIAAFLASHPEFTLVDLKAELAKEGEWQEDEAIWNKSVTLWPIENGHDGFFVCAMEKEIQ